MKNRKLIGALVALLLIMIPFPAFADLGPKPKVTIELKGADGSECWGTLLSDVSSTGPARVWDGIDEHASIYAGEAEIWRAFVDYEDGDGYHFLQWMWDTEEEGGFTWGYYPPEKFKVLLYWPETGEFRSTGILTRYAFDSYFRVDVSDMSVMRNYDVKDEILSFFIRLLITVALEVGIACIVWKGAKELSFIAGVNVLTQILLNVSLMLLNWNLTKGEFYASFAALEVGVTAIEALLYVFVLPHFAKKKCMVKKAGTAVAYAIIANAVSALSGLLIYVIFPGIA